MSTTERLFEAVRDIWEAYYNHPFVQGIKDGTLSAEKFRGYIKQDFMYLKDYTRVFALGAAKAPDKDTMLMFTSRGKSILEVEMDTHVGYLSRLAITLDEIEKTPMELNNISYTSYMLRVAYEEDAAAICGSILACAVSYEILARRMIQENPSCASHELFGSWVTEYASDLYAEENLELIELTDHLTADYTEAHYRHLEEIFVNCSRYELAFWDMGWAMEG